MPRDAENRQNIPKSSIIFVFWPQNRGQSIRDGGEYCPEPADPDSRREMVRVCNGCIQYLPKPTIVFL